MPRLVQIILLVCCLIVPSTVLLTEDDQDYFPAELKCFDSVFNVAAQLHWITEELKKNAPYEIGYALLYSTLVFLPLIPFLCFLIPSKESLVQQYKEEQKRRQMEEESKNDENEVTLPAQEGYDVPAQEPCATIISRSFILFKSISSIGVGLLAAVDQHEPESRVVMETSLTDKREEKARPIIVSKPLRLSKSDSGDGLLAAVESESGAQRVVMETTLTDKREECMTRKAKPIIVSRPLRLSKSDSSIGVGLLAAVDEYEPELRAPRVVMEITFTDMKEEGEVTVAEQSPDLIMVDTADSFVHIKELAEKMCSESTLGKTFAMVAAGAFISFGIYRLFLK